LIMLSDEAGRVLDEALRLSPELRAAIAGTLLESLDDSVGGGSPTDARRRVSRAEVAFHPKTSEEARQGR